METERYDRNVAVNDLLEIWEWCSRLLHVKWQRKKRLRNGCFIGIAVALDERISLSPLQLLQRYKDLPRPLLDEATVATFWEVQPVSLLNLCLGLFTKSSPLIKILNRVRSAHAHNPVLDELAKKMRCREKHFGSEWFSEGHHPDQEVRLLKKEMRTLCKQLRNIFIQEHVAVERLALDVLAKGWQFGEIPASSLVRKTPEKLLNRTNRLKLWQTAQEVLSDNLSEEEKLAALCEALLRKITPSIKAAIEAQGYSADAVVDDILNFDLYKTRDEITA